MNNNMRIVGWRIPDDKGGYDYFFQEPSDFDKAYQRKLYKRDFEPVYVIEKIPCYIDRFKDGIKLFNVGDVINGITMTQEIVDKIITTVNNNAPLFGELNPPLRHFIEFENTSHVMLSSYQHGDTIYANFKVLNNEKGDDLWNAFNKYVPSFRFFGTVTDFKIITVDFKNE